MTLRMMAKSRSFAHLLGLGSKTAKSKRAEDEDREHEDEEEETRRGKKGRRAEDDEDMSAEDEEAEEEASEEDDEDEDRGAKASDEEDEEDAEDEEDEEERPRSKKSKSKRARRADAEDGDDEEAERRGRKQGRKAERNRWGKVLEQVAPEHVAAACAMLSNTSMSADAILGAVKRMPAARRSGLAGRMSAVPDFNPGQDAPSKARSGKSEEQQLVDEMSGVYSALTGRGGSR